MIKYITIALVIGITLFIIKGNSMANMFFSASKHNTDVIIELLLLNKADVVGILNDTIEKSMKYSHTFAKDAHLVIRLRNTGNEGLWGILLCSVKGYGDVRVYVPHLTPKMKEFANFVIPLTGMIIPAHMDKPPVIEIEWEKLNKK